MAPPRILPHLQFPKYAFLPGRSPHPVRNPAGHSYLLRDTYAETAPARSDLVRWGADLFNHGYYWEAHEAWETLWQALRDDVPLRQILKGLILLAATGLKVREGKRVAASRHGGKAHSLFLSVEKKHWVRLQAETGLSVDQLIEWAQIAAATPAVSDSLNDSNPVSVFDFVLNPGAPATK